MKYEYRVKYFQGKKCIEDARALWIGSAIVRAHHMAEEAFGDETICVDMSDAEIDAEYGRPWIYICNADGSPVSDEDKETFRQFEHDQIGLAGWRLENGRYLRRC